MNSKIAASPGVPTDSAVLGPYYRENAPMYKNGDSIVQGKTDGEVTYMHGRVLDAGTGKPIEGVVLDLWQASTNGKYEHIDETQPDFNLRGRFTSDSKGEYGLYCIRPTPYAIPNDGEYHPRQSSYSLPGPANEDFQRSRWHTTTIA